LPSETGEQHDVRREEQAEAPRKQRQAHEVHVAEYHSIRGSGERRGPRPHTPAQGQPPSRGPIGPGLGQNFGCAVR
jgi:hypothetical protein